MKGKKVEERQNVAFISIIPICALLFLSFTLDGCSRDISDRTKSTPDGEKQTIAAAKVESVFSQLLALEKNPERVKALKIAHKDWLTLRKSHCAALVNQDVNKDNKKLTECYEAFDTQRIEIYKNQLISLLYDSPSQGKLPNNPIRIPYSQQQRTNPAVPTSVVVSADAPVAAVTFNNDITEIFDLVNGQLINRIKTTWYEKDKTFGNHFFLTSNGRILIGCVYMPRTELMLWDVRTGELLRHKTLLKANHVHMSQGRYFIYSDDGEMGIYDLAKDEVIWKGKSKEGLFLKGMSPDEKYLIAVGIRGPIIESWELGKATDETFSLVYGATEPVTNSTDYPFAVAFADDNKSFYGTLSSLRHGLIVQRRLPDLKEMRRLQFPKLSFAKLTEIKNTDILLMEAWFAHENMEAFYVDMVNETAQKIPEHTGAHSKMVPLANGQVLLATPFQLQTLNAPSKKGFGKFSDIIGEVVSQDIPIKKPDKESDKVIVPPQISCQDFQIEAIGVYEGTLPNNRSRGFGETIAGYVDVNISHTNLPVKLVLSSYEPVIWRLHVSSDALLSEIYLSGSNKSRVQGIRNIMVSHIGEAYAYKDPNMPSSRYGRAPSLAGVVKKKTACNITNFQGAYKGSNFYIGYITKDISEKKDKIYKYIDENGNVTYRDY